MSFSPPADLTVAELARLSASSATRKKSGQTQLRKGFVPGSTSVICGRGKACTSAAGNKRLKSIVNTYLKPYSEAKNKLEKSSIVSSILSEIKQDRSGGVFVKFECGSWWAVENAVAREKIGCMLRDALHTQYRSSTKAKLARRRALKTGMDEEDTTATCPSSSFFTGLLTTSDPSPGDSTAQQNTLFPADMIFGGIDSKLLYSPLPPSQCRENSFAQTSPKNLAGCRSMIFNYKDDQRSRPQRADFLLHCLPASGSTMAWAWRNSIQGRKKQAGDSSLAKSALQQQVCNLIGDEYDGGDDLPDDLSGIFED